MFLDVKFVDRCRCYQRTLASIYIGICEPIDSVFLVVRSRIVVRNEHSNHSSTLLALVCDVETHGLSFRDTAVFIDCLHRVCDVDVGRCLLDVVAADHLIDVCYILIVLDYLHSRLSFHRRIVPNECDLTASLLILRAQIAHSFRIARRIIFHIRA